MKSMTKSVLKYGSVILLIAVVVVLAWFFISRRENFEDTPPNVPLSGPPSGSTRGPPSGPLPEQQSDNEFPNFVMPYALKKGFFTMDGKKYAAKFAKMNISKKNQRYCMVIDTENRGGVYGIADAGLGSFYSKVDIPNLIYLDNNMIKSDIGSKFIIGKIIGEFTGLKVDTMKGKTLRLTDI